MTRSDAGFAVEISDDGVGGVDIDRGTGLRGLADRLTAIEGRLEVDSETGPRNDRARQHPVPVAHDPSAIDIHARTDMVGSCAFWCSVRGSAVWS